MHGVTGQSGVDHRCDPFDRQGRFGNIGREDDLAAIGRAQGPILVVGRKAAMQRQNERVRPPGQRLQNARRATDLLDPRQEDQNVAVEGIRERPFDGRGNAILQRHPRARRWVVTDLDRMDPALRLNNGTTSEEARHRLDVHRGRHDDKNQVVPYRLANLAEQGQREIGVDVAFVKLVEDHGADAFEKRVGEKLTGQNALGDHAEPRFRGDLVIEANLIADLATQRPAILRGDAARRSPCRHPSRLEQDQTRMLRRETTRRQQRAGNPRRFPRAGRRHQHQATCLAYRLQNLGHNRVDGQWTHDQQSKDARNKEEPDAPKPDRIVPSRFPVGTRRAIPTEERGPLGPAHWTRWTMDDFPHCQKKMVLQGTCRVDN